MPSALQLAYEPSFVAYLHYLEDLANLVDGGYGCGGERIRGVYEAVSAHTRLARYDGHNGVVEEQPQLPTERTSDLYARLRQAWAHVGRLQAEVRGVDRFARAVNAVLPDVAYLAVAEALRALALVQAHDVDGLDAVVAFGSHNAARGAFPYPWSAYCSGCPQLGSHVYGGSAIAGDVSVFSLPQAGTSDARVAMLLRTTRARLLARHFADARRTGVRPGRSRRNLSLQEKEAIADAVAPTTLFDVFSRLQARSQESDGQLFVLGAFDDHEAYQFARGLAVLTDATVAALDALIAEAVGWELFADLAGSIGRRSGTGSSVALQRAAAATRMGQRETR